MTVRIIITGTVQGVGFRPFIYNLARTTGIKGTVSNNSQGVFIEINVKDQKELEDFISLIKERKPPASEIDNITFYVIDEKKFDDFSIIESFESEEKNAFIPVDLKICDDCIKDITDSANRRYLYPFTNCTNCGPRFTITSKIPYDRKNTSMKSFKMCKNCRSEYEDPSNRRFHAQPNACDVCGPYVWTFDGKKKITGIAAIDFIADRIVKGEVVFIKGIGGFHIACDAFNSKSVKKIRDIKKRDFKPLAIMVMDEKDIERYVFINENERRILNSPAAPIVMLKKKDPRMFDYVAPMLDNVGVMLAYTPLHIIVFLRLKKLGFKNPLVMSSGNFKDSPIIKDNAVLLKKFPHIPALFHNRDIINRIDDSVCFIDEFGKTRIVRRARGYTPGGIKLNLDFDKEIFACGADLKNTFAFFRKGTVVLSQHIGDMDIDENIEYYRQTYYNMKKLFSFNPQILVSDMHPAYRSSVIIPEKEFKDVKKVQHHIAHIYSVMAENLFDNDVIGVAFDGTGYGPDGSIWGGEFFVVKNGIVERKAHFNEFYLAGGDRAVKEIWRSFVSFFNSRYDFVLKVLRDKLPLNDIEVYHKMIEKKVNSFRTTSCGRIFDAFSVLTNGKIFSDFEAEGPMRMEALIKKSDEFYSFNIKKTSTKYVIDFSQSVDEVIVDYEKKPEIISVKFHNSVVNSAVSAVEMISQENQIKKVVLSGGVFQNRYILSSLIKKLSNKGFSVYSNSLVPSNDGGISLGQIYFTVLNHRMGNF